MANDLNDSLDDIFGAPAGPVRTVPVRDVPEFKSVAERFEESCAKCNGRGRFISYTGRDVGPCFTCKGNGKQVFKTSATNRAKARDNAASRKARIEQEGIESFKADYPAEFEWLESTAGRWEVAASLLAGLARFGSLTEKQLTLVRNGMARDAARTAAKAAAVVNAPAVDTSKLETAFAKARASAERPGQKGVMVKPVKLLADNGLTVKFQPGSIGSQWEGMLFAKSADGKKLGHVKGGRFIAKFDCSEIEKAAVVDCANDPQKAAVAYGKAFSSCCICGRGLLNDESIARSMGPVCAERFGW